MSFLCRNDTSLLLDLKSFRRLSRFFQICEKQLLSTASATTELKIKYCKSIKDIKMSSRLAVMKSQQRH